MRKLGDSQQSLQRQNEQLDLMNEASLCNGPGNGPNSDSLVASHTNDGGRQQCHHNNNDIPLVQIHADVVPQRNSYGTFYRNTVPANQQLIKSEPIKSENSDPARDANQNAASTNTTPSTAEAIERAMPEATATATNAAQNPQNLIIADLPSLYKCNSCPFMTLNKEIIREHQKNIENHINQPHVRCPGCDNIFGSIVTLEAHLKEEHMMSESDIHLILQNGRKTLEENKKISSMEMQRKRQEGKMQKQIDKKIELQQKKQEKHPNSKIASKFTINVGKYDKRLPNEEVNLPSESQQEVQDESQQQVADQFQPIVPDQSQEQRKSRIYLRNVECLIEPRTSLCTSAVQQQHQPQQQQQPLLLHQQDNLSSLQQQQQQQQQPEQQQQQLYYPLQENEENSQNSDMPPLTVSLPSLDIDGLLPSPSTIENYADTVSNCLNGSGVDLFDDYDGSNASFKTDDSHNINMSDFNFLNANNEFCRQINNNIVVDGINMNENYSNNNNENINIMNQQDLQQPQPIVEEKPLDEVQKIVNQLQYQGDNPLYYYPCNMNNNNYNNNNVAHGIIMTNNYNNNAGTKNIMNQQDVQHSLPIVEEKPLEEVLEIVNEQLHHYQGEIPKDNLPNYNNNTISNKVEHKQKISIKNVHLLCEPAVLSQNCGGNFVNNGNLQDELTNNINNYNLLPNNNSTYVSGDHNYFNTFYNDIVAHIDELNRSNNNYNIVNNNNNNDIALQSNVYYNNNGNHNIVMPLTPVAGEATSTPPLLSTLDNYNRVDVLLGGAYNNYDKRDGQNKYDESSSMSDSAAAAADDVVAHVEPYPPVNNHGNLTETGQTGITTPTEVAADESHKPKQQVFIKNVEVLKEPRGTLHLRTVDELNLMNRREVVNLIAPNLDNNKSYTQSNRNFNCNVISNNEFTNANTPPMKTNELPPLSLFPTRNGQSIGKTLNAAGYPCKKSEVGAKVAQKRKCQEGNAASSKKKKNKNINVCVYKRTYAKKTHACQNQGCKKKFTTLKRLDYHARCHQPSARNDIMICPECPHESFNNCNTLHTHLWRVHEIDMDLYACRLCPFKTPVFSRLSNIHMKIHSDERPFICEKCGGAFKNSKQLKNHRRWHRLHPNKNLNNSNMELPSPPTTTIAITLPSKKKDDDNQSQEKQNVNLELQQPITITMGDKRHIKKKGSIKCDICQNVFNNKVLLKSHQLLAHSEKKAYECDKCHYVSSDRNAYRRHNMIHDNIKKYNCPFCASKFIQSVAYQKHLLLKHTEKAHLIIHKCTLCSFSTINEGLLKTHMTKQHSAKNDIISVDAAVHKLTS